MTGVNQLGVKSETCIALTRYCTLIIALEPLHAMCICQCPPSPLALAPLT